jgi:hypothetical protein
MKARSPGSSPGMEPLIHATLPMTSKSLLSTTTLHDIAKTHLQLGGQCGQGLLQAPHNWSNHLLCSVMHPQG